MSLKLTPETAAIFFSSETHVKRGISSEYVIVISFARAYSSCEKRVEDDKRKNSCQQWDTNPVPSAYEANALSNAQLDLISIEHLKVNRVDCKNCVKVPLGPMVHQHEVHEGT